jgi:hypothetical protein
LLGAGSVPVRQIRSGVVIVAHTEPEEDVIRIISARKAKNCCTVRTCIVHASHAVAPGIGTHGTQISQTKAGAVFGRTRRLDRLQVNRVRRSGPPSMQANA